MPAELVGGDQLFADHRLRGGHERGVSRGGGLVFRIALPAGRDRAGGAGTRICPEIRKGGGLLAVCPQQRKRIGKIGVKQRVVADHRPRARIALQRGAIHAERPAPARQRLGDTERGCGAQQALGRGKAEPRAVAGGRGVAGAFCKQIKQPTFYAGRKNLSIGEASHEIERTACAGPHNRAGQRERGSPLLESRVRQKTIAQADPALLEPCLMGQIHLIGHIHMSITLDI